MSDSIKTFEMKAAFPFKKKIVYDIEWPVSFDYMGYTYFQTAKYGKRTTDGCPSAEYEHITDSGKRLWIDLDGTILPD